MKRIDDKIKEIEQKDKKNRILYIGFVVLIAIFMIFAFKTSKTIKTQGDTISEQDETIQAQLITEQELTQQLKDSIELLNKSLKPKQYWAQINKDKSVESYIEYITNDWGIDKPQENVVKAYKTLHSDNLKVEQVGWLYIGLLNRDNEFYDKDNRAEIVWPKDRKGALPKKNDIIKLIAKSDIKTYKKYYKTNLGKRPTGKGWRVGTKAIIIDTYYDPGHNNNYFIKIKYY